MSFKDKKGIQIANGFKLSSNIPMDVRTIVENEEELQGLIDSKVVHEGLTVWVKSLNKKLTFNGNEFFDDSGEAINLGLSSKQQEGAEYLGSITVNGDTFNIPAETDPINIKMSNEKKGNAPYLGSLQIGNDTWNIPDNNEPYTMTFDEENVEGAKELGSITLFGDTWNIVSKEYVDKTIKNSIENKLQEDY